ncbi:related to pigp_human [Cephalotrichum gorgonifer]|uniref:Related to pigp_human n=1 Tax=Cephalotrichum gorgonifer TaxID=2041049 RepID=A0AAE8SV46_9PEZI|nr:related to pigp_human [Cephalotrichum gorgonifer]
MANREDEGHWPTFSPSIHHQLHHQTAPRFASTYRPRHRNRRYRGSANRSSTRSDNFAALQPGQTEENSPPRTPERCIRRTPKSDTSARLRACRRLGRAMALTIEEETLEGHESDTSSSSSASDAPPSRPTTLPHANYFAPPLYGRPGTSLPPSPSITSLLIPSRPTTPDLSDDEAEVELTRRKAPQVPTYEYYGFVLYLFSSLTFGVYLLWSYLPSPMLHAMGIYYYPNRWWSLAIPAWIAVAMMYVYVSLASYNVGYLTRKISSAETVVDEAAVVAVLDSKGRAKGAGRRGGLGAGVDLVRFWGEGTDGVMDIPLGGVCEILHGAGGFEGDEDVEEEGSWVWRVLGM